MMDTYPNGLEPSRENDLFEGPADRSYSPLETLVRQASLKDGWRVKNAPASRFRAAHGPTDVVASTGQTQSDESNRKSQASTLAPPRQHTGRDEPNSPLLHTDFRQSTFSAFGNASFVSDPNSSFNSEHYRDSTQSGAPVIPRRGLTMDDETQLIERFRMSDQWESASDVDTGSPTEQRVFLPPSFRFSEANSTAFGREGGRPLSDRSMVLPPSVKGLALRGKGDGPWPKSPAAMSFKSFNSLETHRRPFHESIPSVPVPRDAPLVPPPSIRNDVGPPRRNETADSLDTEFLDNYYEDDTELDFADALEGSKPGDWNHPPAQASQGHNRASTKSDSDPFAFRQYEGKTSIPDTTSSTTISQEPTPRPDFKFPPSSKPLDAPAISSLRTPSSLSLSPSKPSPIHSKNYESPPQTDTQLPYDNDDASEYSEQDENPPVSEPPHPETPQPPAPATWSHPPPDEDLRPSQSVPTPIIEVNGYRAPSQYNTPSATRMNFSRPLRIVTASSEPQFRGVSGGSHDSAALSGLGTAATGPATRSPELEPPSSAPTKPPRDIEAGGSRPDLDLSDHIIIPELSHSTASSAPSQYPDDLDQRPPLMSHSSLASYSYRQSAASLDSFYGAGQQLGKFPAPPGSGMNSAAASKLTLSINGSEDGRARSESAAGSDSGVMGPGNGSVDNSTRGEDDRRHVGTLPRCIVVNKTN